MPPTQARNALSRFLRSMFPRCDLEVAAAESDCHPPPHPNLKPRLNPGKDALTTMRAVR